MSIVILGLVTAGIVAIVDFVVFEFLIPERKDAKFDDFH
jgi:hypothetical protein